MEQTDRSMKTVREEFKVEVINLWEGINRDKRKHVEAQNTIRSIKEPPDKLGMAKNETRAK